MKTISFSFSQSTNELNSSLTERPGPPTPPKAKLSGFIGCCFGEVGFGDGEDTLPGEDPKKCFEDPVKPEAEEPGIPNLGLIEEDFTNEGEEPPEDCLLPGSLIALSEVDLLKDDVPCLMLSVIGDRPGETQKKIRFIIIFLLLFTLLIIIIIIFFFALLCITHQCTILFRKRFVLQLIKKNSNTQFL